MQNDGSVTRQLVVDARQPDPAMMEEAGAVLRGGGLVAFPTETVYGLGANALDARAVGSVFRAKGRPADNPLIVHLASARELDHHFSHVPDQARALAHQFWPGPLTLVLPDQRPFPPEVTAGLATVAVRVPDHPVALALIRAAGVPVAAPSANLSGRPSPTTAGHVRDDLSGSIDLILDGGPAGLGVESTVLDLSGLRPVILRPGGVTQQQLERVLGPVELDPALAGGPGAHKPRSPGLKYKHYAPRAQLLLFEGPGPERLVAAMLARADRLTREGQRVGILAYEETRPAFVSAGYPVVVAGSCSDPASVAAGLYDALRWFDNMDVDIILAQAIPSQGVGLAVMDRLRRAAGGHIVMELEKDESDRPCIEFS